MDGPVGRQLLLSDLLCAADAENIVMASSSSKSKKVNMRDDDFDDDEDSMVQPATSDSSAASENDETAAPAHPETLSAAASYDGRSEAARGEGTDADGEDVRSPEAGKAGKDEDDGGEDDGSVGRVVEWEPEVEAAMARDKGLTAAISVGRGNGNEGKLSDDGAEAVGPTSSQESSMAGAVGVQKSFPGSFRSSSKPMLLSHSQAFDSTTDSTPPIPSSGVKCKVEVAFLVMDDVAKLAATGSDAPTARVDDVTREMNENDRVEAKPRERGERGAHDQREHRKLAENSGETCQTQPVAMGNRTPDLSGTATTVTGTTARLVDGIIPSSGGEPATGKEGGSGCLAPPDPPGERSRSLTASLSEAGRKRQLDHRGSYSTAFADEEGSQATVSSEGYVDAVEAVPTEEAGVEAEEWLDSENYLGSSAATLRTANTALGDAEMSATEVVTMTTTRAEERAVAVASTDVPRTLVLSPPSPEPESSTAEAEQRPETAPEAGTETLADVPVEAATMAASATGTEASTSDAAPADAPAAVRYVPPPLATISPPIHPHAAQMAPSGHMVPTAPTVMSVPPISMPQPMAMAPLPPPPPPGGMGTPLRQHSVGSGLGGGLQGSLHGGGLQGSLHSGGRQHSFISVTSSVAAPQHVQQQQPGRRKIHFRLVEEAEPAHGAASTALVTSGGTGGTRKLFQNIRRKMRSQSFNEHTSTAAAAAAASFGSGEAANYHHKGSGDSLGSHHSYLIDRGTLVVSWYDGTGCAELQEHVLSSVSRKLGLDGGRHRLEDLRIIDDTVEPHEEIVLCPYIPDGSQFVLKFKIKDTSVQRAPSRQESIDHRNPNYFRMDSVVSRAPDSPSAAPSPYPSTLNLQQLQLLLQNAAHAQQDETKRKEPRVNPSLAPKLPSLPLVSSRPQPKGEVRAENRPPAAGAAVRNETIQEEVSQRSNAAHQNDETKKDESSMSADELVLERLSQLNELLLEGKIDKDRTSRFRRRSEEKKQVIFVLANYFVLFLSLIAISAEIHERVPGWMEWVNAHVDSVQSCSADRDALYECVEKGNFSGLVAAFVFWLTRSATTKNILLFGFDTPQRLWTVVYEALVTAVCWGTSYMFIRRGLNPDTRTNFLHKYWKDAVYGSLAGFNAAFMKAVLKNLIPQDQVLDVLESRQLRIVDWVSHIFMQRDT